MSSKTLIRKLPSHNKNIQTSISGDCTVNTTLNKLYFHAKSWKYKRFLYLTYNYSRQISDTVQLTKDILN